MMSGAGLEPAGRLRSDVLIKSKTMLTSPSLVPIHIKLSGIMPPFLWWGGPVPSSIPSGSGTPLFPAAHTLSSHSPQEWAITW